MSDSVSKSWFCVFNHPEEHGYIGTPDEILDRLRDEWIQEHPTRTGAWTYCISASGLRHVHMVLEDQKAMRFSAIKNSYAVGMHFEPTKGSKEQAEDYISKKGKFVEKGEEVITSLRYGEIKGAQGSRRDLEIIYDLISSGHTPSQILDLSVNYFRYEKIIRSAFWHQKIKDTPAVREVTVYWHVGNSGTGKTNSYSDMVSTHGRDYVYMVSDYENGFLDSYEGQPVLFLDEYRGQLRYATLLSILDKYITQVHCRFKNVYMVWTEVRITSVKTPYEVYQNLITDDAERQIDSFEQLKRRINFIVYHWKDGSGYHSRQIPMSDFQNRAQLEALSRNDDFAPLPQGVESPFQCKLDI